MSDTRVPGKSIIDGRRRPVMLSSVAVGDLENLEDQTKRSLAVGLKRLADGSLKGKDLLVRGPLGERGYKYIAAGEFRAVYREMSPAELVEQGYEKSLARKGGIFVVDIVTASEFRERTYDE